MKKTIFIFKYALSDGILKVVAEISEDGCARYKTPGDCFAKHYSRSAYALTFEEAKKKAEEMRKRKIASVKKQLERLEKLTFPAPVERK